MLARAETVSAAVAAASKAKRTALVRMVCLIGVMVTAASSAQLVMVALVLVVAASAVWKIAVRVSRVLKEDNVSKDNFFKKKENIPTDSDHD